MFISYPPGNTEFEFQRMHEVKVFSRFLLENVVDYSPIKNCVWVYYFVSGRKIRNSLLDNEKSIT